MGSIRLLNPHDQASNLIIASGLALCLLHSSRLVETSFPIMMAGVGCSEPEIYLD